MSKTPCNLSNWYAEEIGNDAIIYDEAQYHLVKILDQFTVKLNQKSILKNLYNRIFPEQKLGFYLFGSVGCGKSMIANACFLYLASTRKIRLHFHAFIKEVQRNLSELKDKADPIRVIAGKLKRQYDIIFLDEMHVSDIATAMILKQLFSYIFKVGIYMVITSNYHPNKLYQDGLIRERFVSTIELLKEKLEIYHLSSSTDYRLINAGSINNFFLINLPEAKQRLIQTFNKINQQNNYEENSTISIQHRQIPFIRKSNNIIWFDFSIICGDLRSQLDYLELSQNFTWFIVENIIKLYPEDKNVARRLTWLVDVLYDESKKLILSSATKIEDLYVHGDFSNEFKRTISRLLEMQTREYLQKNPYLLFSRNVKAMYNIDESTGVLTSTRGVLL